MTGKKRSVPSRQEVDRLLRQLEQAPRIPDAPHWRPESFSPWNVSMKKPAVKRTIACALDQKDQK